MSRAPRDASVDCSTLVASDELIVTRDRGRTFSGPRYIGVEHFELASWGGSPGRRRSYWRCPSGRSAAYGAVGATSRTTLSVARRRTRAAPPRPSSRGASRARRTPTADMPQRIAGGCRRLPLGRPSRRTRKPAARRRLSSLLFIDEIDDAVKHAKDAKHVPARVQPDRAARGHRVKPAAGGQEHGRTAVPPAWVETSAARSRYRGWGCESAAPSARVSVAKHSEVGVEK